MSTKWRMIVAAVVNAGIWAALYYLFLRTPWPEGWNLVRNATPVGVLGGVIGDVFGRLISGHLLPVSGGAAIGIVLGGATAYVSDIMISTWQRVWWGLTDTGFFTLWLWLAITAGWGGCRSHVTTSAHSEGYPTGMTTTDTQGTSPRRRRPRDGSPLTA